MSVNRGWVGLGFLWLEVLDNETKSRAFALVILSGQQIKE